MVKMVIYINEKNQLIKISKKKVDHKGSAATRDMRELHEILSFDINKLEQAKQHTVDSEDLAWENLFKEPFPVIKTSMYEEDKKKEEEEAEDLNLVPK